MFSSFMANNYSPDLRIAVAYGATTLASSCMNNVFVTYYVDYFLHVALVPYRWFIVGQIIYLIWNSLNDPLFGWLSDSRKANNSRRLSNIRYGGPLWAVVFFLMWFQWSSLAGSDSPYAGTLAGLHFIISICCYDGLLSYVLIAHNAMLADMTSNFSLRVLCNSCASIFSAIGSISVFFCYYYWNRSDLSSFHCFCFVLCLLSIFAFRYTVNVFSNIHYTSLQRNRFRSSGSIEKDIEVNPIDSEIDQLPSHQTLLLLSKDIFNNRNFVSFVIFNFFQVFDCHFEKNFFALFLDHITGDRVGSLFRSCFICSTFILPHLIVVSLTPVITRIGVYSTIRSLVLLKLAMASSLYLSNSTLGWESAALFMFVCRILTEAICKLTPLIVSDIVDEDLKLHNRSKSMSAVIFGLDALVTKPAVSLAPIFGAFVLQQMMDEDESSGGSLVIAASSNFYVNSRSGAFSIQLLVPIFCCLIQIVVWTAYDLRGASHIKLSDA